MGIGNSKSGDKEEKQTGGRERGSLEEKADSIQQVKSFIFNFCFLKLSRFLFLMHNK